ncbi:hypothetical protein [Spiroplasma endosymbiont of Glossina fuscipes fuscipes]|uniref:hypothetical protein n=1 Tax=Spiroplasma endosymbiont of Glossina fuscipes fuscipes TaxID=2004463 RepID=UPI003C779AA9
MTKLTIKQTKQLSGGKISGAFLTGTEGGYKATNGSHLTWSDKHNNLNHANYGQILFV